VFLPKKAPWLDEFETEVMAFPHGAHDDQVGSMAQALDWVSRRIRNQVRQGYF
jgi:phage terminase large subunit-like protein